MNSPSNDFVTVDMRGLKAALVARAQADRVSVSALVRRAVACDLGTALPPAAQQELAPPPTPSSHSTVKLSIRLTTAEAGQLARGAQAAGLSRGAYLAGLVANVPVLTSGASRTDHINALIASSAEMSTLTRNINHLTSLLQQGEFRAAREYRAVLETLAGDIRGHLMLASRVLADLRPRSQHTNAQARTTT